MSAQVIETERLSLHLFCAASASDVAFTHQLLNEPSFVHSIGDRGVRTLEAAHAYLMMGPVASYEANGFGMYRLQEQSSGASIGMVGLVKRATLQHVDLGYALLPAYWGKGYALEAARAVRDHAHGVIGLPRIVAITQPGNAGSIRVLEKLDFRFQAVVQWTPENVELKLFAHEARS